MGDVNHLERDIYTFMRSAKYDTSNKKPQEFEKVHTYTYSALITMHGSSLRVSGDSSTTGVGMCIGRMRLIVMPQVPTSYMAGADQWDMPSEPCMISFEFESFNQRYLFQH